MQICRRDTSRRQPRDQASSPRQGRAARGTSGQIQARRPVARLPQVALRPGNMPIGWASRCCTCLWNFAPVPLHSAYSWTRNSAAGRGCAACHGCRGRPSRVGDEDRRTRGGPGDLRRDAPATARGWRRRTATQACCAHGGRDDLGSAPMPGRRSDAAAPTVSCRTCSAGSFITLALRSTSAASRPSASEMRSPVQVTSPNSVSIIAGRSQPSGPSCLAAARIPERVDAPEFPPTVRAVLPAFLLLAAINIFAYHGRLVVTLVALPLARCPRDTTKPRR